MAVVTVDGPGGKRSLTIADPELVEYILKTVPSAEFSDGVETQAAPAKKGKAAAKAPTPAAVKSAVGDDVVLAVEALAEEMGRERPRKALVEHLEAIITPVYDDDLVSGDVAED